MILTGLLFAFALSFVSSKDVEPVAPPSSETNSDADQVTNLLFKLDDVALIPETRGRSDIEIEEEIPQEQPPQGYFYPKPSKPFDLPVFNTLQPDVALDGSTFLNPGLEDGGEFERVPRSPQRPQSLFPYPNVQGYRPRPRPQNFYPIPGNTDFPSRFPGGTNFPNRFPGGTNFPNRFPGNPIRPLPFPGAPYTG